jgi:hypothetical protein
VQRPDLLDELAERDGLEEEGIRADGEHGADAGLRADGGQSDERHALEQL